MANVKLDFHVEGLNEIMKSGEMQGLISQAAGQIASAAGNGFAVEPVHNINFIAISRVYAKSYAARKICKEDGNYLRKIAGGVSI